VPRPTITNVESGEQEGLTLENARKLARALGITIDMLAGKGEKESEELAAVASELGG
jgi:transcriptional regulator with XRE-family HTH domain